MPITVACPSCSRELRVPDALLGKKAKCPSCATVMLIPIDLTPEQAPSPNDEERPRRRRRRRHYDDHPRPEQTSGFAIAALVLGVVSFPTACLCTLFGIPVSVTAIILGAIGMNRGGKGLAITGLVLGIVTLILCIVLFALHLGLGMMNERKGGFR